MLGLGGVALAALVLLAVAGQRWASGLSLAVHGPTGAASQAVREPITGDIELTYKYPAYTGLQPRW